MLHMLQLFQRHVASVCFECFKCFRDMFHLCVSGRMLQVCLSRCYICFTHTLHVFYLDVCIWLQWFSGVFSSVSEVCFKCFNCFQTYVATVVFGCFKIDRMLHLSSLHLLLHRLSWRRQGIHTTSWSGPSKSEASHPLPLMSLGQHGPRMARETE
jgi:hypothetical protein